MVYSNYENGLDYQFPMAQTDFPNCRVTGNSEVTIGASLEEVQPVGLRVLFSQKWTPKRLKRNQLCIISRLAAGPVSRILSALAGGTVIPLGRASLPGSSDLPGTHPRRASACRDCSRTGPLFGLAPCGVCPAPFITKRAVRSYRTFSPLPIARRYVFCGAFRRLI